MDVKISIDVDLSPKYWFFYICFVIGVIPIAIGYGITYAMSSYIKFIKGDYPI